MAKKTKLIPAAALVRMSTDQQDDSPRQQKAEINRLAEREGYKIVRWYEDLGISGHEIEKRPALMTLLKDAGIILHTVCDGRIDLDDFGDRIKWALAGELGEQDLRDKAQDMVRGKIAAAKAGKLQSKEKYGYDKMFYDEAGQPVKRVPYGTRAARPREWSVKFVISEYTEHVDTVRWIFEKWTTTDCGLGAIARELNERGIPSPAGVQWCASTIRGSVDRVLVEFVNPVPLRNRAISGSRGGGAISNGLRREGRAGGRVWIVRGVVRQVLVVNHAFADWGTRVCVSVLNDGGTRKPEL